ncbi:MAG: S46 family peptidase [Betaproteobacteria bacterium]|nr:MAG: S46 family peptidase [Betaproteobacteria bacterium]
MPGRRWLTATGSSSVSYSTAIWKAWADDSSFVYTDDKARAIAVDSRAIVEALTKIYDAREIVREITRR